MDKSVDDFDPRTRWLVRGTGPYNRARLALFLTGFATFSLLYCVQPLLPLFSEDFGISAAVASLALSLTTGFLALAIMGAATISEGLGRRGVMLVSMLAASSLNIALAFAPNWSVMLVIRALEGFVLGGVPAVAMTYLAEEVEPPGLGATMGLYVAGSAFGGMMGRVGTGFLVEILSWRPAMAIMGGIGLLAAAGFGVLLPPSRNFIRRPGFDPGYHAHAWGGHLRHSALPLLFAIGFLVMGAFVTIYNYAGFRLTAPPYNLNQSELGLLFSVYVFGIIASSVAGSLADRIGRRVVLLAGIAVEAAGVALTLAPGLFVILAGIIGLTAGFFISHSVASGWVGRLAVRAKGHASSLYLLSYYLGSSVAGSAGGWFWGRGGWPAVVAFTFVMLGLAALAAWRLGPFETRPSS